MTDFDSKQQTLKKTYKIKKSPAEMDIDSETHRMREIVSGSQIGQKYVVRSEEIQIGSYKLKTVSQISFTSFGIIFKASPVSLRQSKSTTIQWIGLPYRCIEYIKVNNDDFYFFVVKPNQELVNWLSISLRLNLSLKTAAGSKSLFKLDTNSTNRSEKYIIIHCEEPFLAVTGIILPNGDIWKKKLYRFRSAADAKSFLKAVEPTVDNREDLSSSEAEDEESESSEITEDKRCHLQEKSELKSPKKVEKSKIISTLSKFKERKLTSSNSEFEISERRKDTVIVLSDSDEETNPDSRELLVYPGTENSRDTVVLNFEDIDCLQESAFLNDQIVNFWATYLRRDILSDVDRDRSHVFCTFFYTALKRGLVPDSEGKIHLSRIYKCIKQWTNKVDIFTKEVLFIPISEEDHWFLAAICYPSLVCEELNARASPSRISNVQFSHPDRKKRLTDEDKNSNKVNSPSKRRRFSPNDDDSCSDETANSSEEPIEPVHKNKPCILIFDSYMSHIPNKKHVHRALYAFLTAEWRERTASDERLGSALIPAYQPRVPQQPNHDDCGLYMLHYIETFFKKPFPTDNPSLINLSNWFTWEDVRWKRQTIFTTIKNLIKQRCPKKLKHFPEIIFDHAAAASGSGSGSISSKEDDEQTVSFNPGSLSQEENEESD